MSLLIHVNNITSKFESAPDNNIIGMLRHELRYKIDGAQFMKPKWARKRQSKVVLPEYKYLYNKKTNSFPTGVLHIVEEILKSFGASYKIIDNRPSYPITDPIACKFSLRDYQQDAEAKILEHKNCIVRIATGGGKTAIFTSALGKLNGYNRIVVVRRQMLFFQTIKVLEEQLGVEVGRIGAGTVDIKPLTVAMIPTMARVIDPEFKFVKEEEDDEDDETELNQIQRDAIKAFMQSCHCIVMDEVHGVAADTAQLVANAATNARYRWGFSATPWRTDGKDILITAVTGQKVVNIDASYLIERGFLVPPHIHFLKSPKPPIGIWDQGKYHEVYKEYIVNNKDRNDAIFKVACQAWERCEHILILVHQIEHGQQLLERFEQAGMWAEYVHGTSTVMQREEIIGRFCDKIRSILIGSSILDEGIDIPQITTLINAGGGKSSARYYQKIGRAIRLCEDKKRAIVVDFLDEGIRYLQDHAHERLRIIRTESLYKIKVQGEKT